MVPQLVVCHKCRAVLYEGAELKSSEDIVESYEGKCPACRKKLSVVPKNFEVKFVEETNPLKIEPRNKRRARKKGLNKPGRPKSVAEGPRRMKEQESKGGENVHPMRVRGAGEYVRSILGPFS